MGESSHRSLFAEQRLNDVIIARSVPKRLEVAHDIWIDVIGATDRALDLVESRRRDKRSTRINAWGA